MTNILVDDSANILVGVSASDLIADFLSILVTNSDNILEDCNNIRIDGDSCSIVLGECTNIYSDLAFSNFLVVRG